MRKWRDGARQSGFYDAPFKRASPAKAASAAVPVSVGTGVVAGRETSLSERFASKALARTVVPVARIPLPPEFGTAFA